MTVDDLCVHSVVSVERDTPLAQCAKIMHDDHVGSLIVTETRGGNRQVPVGILTDRDITIEVVAFSLDPATITAGDIMAQPLVTAQSGEDIMSVLARMREKGVRRVPIVASDGSLTGILSADNIWEMLAQEVDALVRVMKSEQLREFRTRPLASVKL